MSVIKIKIGLAAIFSATLPTPLHQFLKGKTPQLYQAFLPDLYPAFVRQHCSSLHFASPLPTRSILRTVSSFIPRSSDNWLYYQLKKIGEVVGWKIQNGKPIDYDIYNPDSFMEVMDSMEKTSNKEEQQGEEKQGQVNLQQVPNSQKILKKQQKKQQKRLDSQQKSSVFSTIIKLKDEQCIYLLFRIMQTLGDHITPLDPTSLLSQLTTCTSLSVMFGFYNLVRIGKVRLPTESLTNSRKVTSSFIFSLSKQALPANCQIGVCFAHLSEKLGFAVMKDGWKSFLIKTKVKDQGQFIKDVFRDIDCDIVLFVALRQILGTPNSQCKEHSLDPNYKDMILRDITAKCSSTSFYALENNDLEKSKKDKGKNKEQSKSQVKPRQLLLTLDGPYLHLPTLQQKRIHSIFLPHYNVYPNPPFLQLMAKQNSQSICIPEDTIRDYVEKGIRQRRQLWSKIIIDIKSMKYPLQ